MISGTINSFDIFLCTELDYEADEDEDEDE